MIYEVVKATALYMGLTFSLAGVLAFSFIAILFVEEYMKEFRLMYLGLTILFTFFLFVMMGVLGICLVYLGGL